MKKNSIKNTRINSEVQRELSRIIAREIKDPRISPMTSVVSAEVTADLKLCKVYISVLGDKKARDDTMEGLKSAVGFIRRELAHTVNLRLTPEIKFIEDQSIEHGVNMTKEIEAVSAADRASEAEREAKEISDVSARILSLLDSSRTVMIAGHIRPDGDCIGSCVGLYNYICDNYPDTEADVRLEEVPETYSLVPGTGEILTRYDDNKVYDLFIALDASDEERLGEAAGYFETAGHRVCIDHHISNPLYADDNLVVPSASSTSEILTDLMDADKISYDAAFALYTGIVSDTGVFKYSCTSRHTMDAAGLLMEKGIPYTDIIDNIYYRKTYLQNRLLGWCLMNSSLEADGLVITCIVNREITDELGAGHDDLEGVIDQMRVTEGVEAAVLASDVSGSGEYKFSLRSNHTVDVSKIAGYFGGGGHVRAAGFTGGSDAAADMAKVIDLIREQAG